MDACSKAVCASPTVKCTAWMRLVQGASPMIRQRSGIASLLGPYPVGLCIHFTLEASLLEACCPQQLCGHARYEMLHTGNERCSDMICAHTSNAHIFRNFQQDRNNKQSAFQLSDVPGSCCSVVGGTCLRQHADSFDFLNHQKVESIWSPCTAWNFPVFLHPQLLTCGYGLPLV